MLSNKNGRVGQGSAIAASVSWWWAIGCASFILCVLFFLFSCFSSLLFIELSLSQPMNFNTQPPTLRFSSILVWGEGSKQMAVRCSDACQVKSRHTFEFLKGYTAMYHILTFVPNHETQKTHKIRNIQKHSDVPFLTAFFIFLIRKAAFILTPRIACEFCKSALEFASFYSPPFITWHHKQFQLNCYSRLMSHISFYFPLNYFIQTEVSAFLTFSCAGIASNSKVSSYLTTPLAMLLPLLLTSIEPHQHTALCLFQANKAGIFFAFFNPATICLDHTNLVFPYISIICEKMPKVC